MEANVEKNKQSCLPGKLSSGPCGLGDPEDRTLRKVELEVMIPKVARERMKREECRETKEAFDECCIKNGYLMTFRCREENRRYQDCMAKWFFDDKFMAECTETYLQRRAEFRKTGEKLKTKRFGH